MTTDTHVYIFDSISGPSNALTTATNPLISSLTVVYARGYNSADGKGGGLLRRSATATSHGEVMTFYNASDNSYWVRDLNGGALDAYMAGAYGDGRLTTTGYIDMSANSHDDTIALQRLLSFYRSSYDVRTSSVNLHIRIGDGIFKVGTLTSGDFAGKGLDLTSFPSNPRDWLIDGTGATLLGGCKDVPVIDASDSRFGSFLNLQIIGAIPDGASDTDHYPSCGIRIGRKADNEAANQMTMDHVGIRGLFKIAACLNVASEQFTANGCEFSNDKEGDGYGYAGDAFNMLQWGRPVAIDSVDNSAAPLYKITTSSNHGLVDHEFVILKQVSYAGTPNPFDNTVFEVTRISASVFQISFPLPQIVFSGGSVYKRLFGGAIDTPGLTPFAQNSFKQQLHQQANYRAKKGTAGIFEGTDSQHIYRSCHPTCGYYPVGTASYTATLTPGPQTLISSVQTGGPGTGELVSFTSSGLPDRLDTRLFKLVGAVAPFELVDPLGRSVDSRGWGLAGAVTVSGMQKQRVAGGDDATAGGFGMRIVVSGKSGCDLSEYGLHHEPGDSGDTTWWASIERFENLLLPNAAPGSVQFTDVTFKEAAAHGRGGFLLAKSAGISGITMLGGAITLAHPQVPFGTTGHANKLLTWTGTGANPWTLVNTDVVVEEVALLDVTTLAGFSGRLTAEEAAFTYGAVANYPGTLALIRALAGQTQSVVTASARLVDALLGALDVAGVLAKLDGLHVFAAVSEVAARVNLANPASGPLTYMGSPLSFAAGLGFTGAGSTSQYLSSPIIPTLQTKYGQNQSTMAVVSRTSGTTSSIDLSLAGASYAYINPWSGSPLALRLRANNTNDLASTPAGASSSAGFFAWSRTLATVGATYFGAGATVQPTTAALALTAGSSQLPTSGFEVLYNGSHQLSAVAFGNKLTQTEMNALYSALKTYLTAVGAWV